MKRFILLLLFSIPIIIAAQQSDTAEKRWQGKMTCGIVSKDTTPIPLLRLRCGGTISNSNQPLIVLDGVVISYGSLSAINPNTIEAITILKDDKAASLFGSAARYGVILISSKKGTIFIKDKETGQPVSNASVKIKLKAKLLELAADSIGLVNLGKENYQSVAQIGVSCIGYEPVTWKADSVKATLPVTIQLTRKHLELDEVVVVCHPAIYCRKLCCGSWVKCIKSYPTTKFPNQQFSSQLSVYPNPVEKGGKLTIVGREAISCAYQIFSIAGALIQSGVITAVAEQPVSIATNPFPSGSYILRITNRTTGSLLTQKIIVQ